MPLPYTVVWLGLRTDVRTISGGRLIYMLSQRCIRTLYATNCAMKR
jgi:hypothetical protein